MPVSQPVQNSSWPQTVMTEVPGRRIDLWLRSPARDAVRRLKAANAEPIQVLFRGGTYFLTNEVVFLPEDSGTAAAPITYTAFPGEKPIFSGGKTITGWKPGEGGLWTTEIPQVKQGNWYFRQLCVDGNRRPRRDCRNRG